MVKRSCTMQNAHAPGPETGALCSTLRHGHNVLFVTQCVAGQGKRRNDNYCCDSSACVMLQLLTWAHFQLCFLICGTGFSDDAVVVC